MKRWLIFIGLVCLAFVLPTHAKAGTQRPANCNITVPADGQVLHSSTLQTIADCAGNLPFSIGIKTTVAADGGTFSVTFASAFQTSVGAILITPSAYSGSDNAVVMCRVTTQSVTGFSGTCGGGQSGSTITLFYLANGQ